ncbi:MAG TPA: sigma-70 family RNA polymerase sigma factor [Herpetosiphonaceae bacterium]
MDDLTDQRQLYAACGRDGSPEQARAFELLWQQMYRIAYAMLRAAPDGDALAADCAQLALIKLHRNLGQCRQPEAVREWAGQIVRRTVLDELRRPAQRRRANLPDDDDHLPWLAAPELLETSDDLAALLREVVERGPLSARSRRVVAGRYFAEQPDEALARAESELAGQQVLPSHIQVTRAKNLAALRRDPALLERLRELLD